MGISGTYAEAFHALKGKSKYAVHYHNRLQQCEHDDKTMRMKIDKWCTEIESEEENASEEDHENDPLLHVVFEAQEAMYTIVAEDSMDCSTNLLQKVKQKLAKYSEDSTHTAGLENVIIIKVGCKDMLRSNIDVTLGLVNGTIRQFGMFSDALIMETR